MSDSEPTAAALRLTPLGVGDAFSAVHYSACLLLQHRDAGLLIDAPHPLRKMLREGAGLDVDAVNAVVVTHLHPDHVCGLELLAYDVHNRMGRRLPVYALEELLPELTGARFRLERHCELTALDESDAVEVGPFSLCCQRTRHQVPTAALQITAGERTLGYSADTPYDEDLIQWLAAADLIVHEIGPAPHHTPLERLASLSQAWLQRTRLIHYADDLDVEGCPIELLCEGHGYEV